MGTAGRLGEAAPASSLCTAQGFGGQPSMACPGLPVSVGALGTAPTPCPHRAREPAGQSRWDRVVICTDVRDLSLSFQARQMVPLLASSFRPWTHHSALSSPNHQNCPPRYLPTCPRMAAAEPAWQAQGGKARPCDQGEVRPVLLAAKGTTLSKDLRTGASLPAPSSCARSPPL